MFRHCSIFRGKLVGQFFSGSVKSNAGGVGFEHGGYSIFRGTQSDQLSGALDISWAA